MDCSTCPELDMDAWGEELLAPLGGRRYPLGGTMELTERCNLSCLHCYINQPAGSQAARASELTTAQIKGILDQVVDAGCLFLLFTGGEPLLRPDFLEIYRYARQRGMLVSLFTNGTLMTPQIADALADMQPHSVEITLYGATRETYEKVTQAPGSYDRCRRGIDLLLDRGIRLTLKTVLMRANIHELPELRALAERAGVKFRYDGLLWPRLDGDPQPFEQRLSIRELIALDENDPERQRQWNKMAEASRGQLARSEYLYGCGAGLRSFHIDSAGRVGICMMTRSVVYDLLQVPFREAWERLGELRKLKRQQDTPCRTCAANGLCTQCPAWSQIIYGDDETPVEFVCELGRLRASRTAASLETV